MGMTKLKFETVDTGYKTSTKTWGYVNPEASDYVLKSLVTGAYALSRNSVRTIHRVDTRDITNATEEVTPVAGGISASFSSTSDFFSANSTTFKNFLQAGLTAEENKIGNSNFNTDNTALNFEIFANDEYAGIPITYSKVAELIAGSNSNIQTVVDYLNDKIANPEDGNDQVNVVVSYDSTTQTLTFTGTDTSDEATLTIDIDAGLADADGFGNYVLKSLYDNTSDTSAFDVDDEEYSMSLVAE